MFSIISDSKNKYNIFGPDFEYSSRIKYINPHSEIEKCVETITKPNNKLAENIPTYYKNETKHDVNFCEFDKIFIFNSDGGIRIMGCFILEPHCLNDTNNLIKEYTFNILNSINTITNNNNSLDIDIQENSIKIEFDGKENGITNRYHIKLKKVEETDIILSIEPYSKNNKYFSKSVKEIYSDIIDEGMFKNYINYDNLNIFIYNYENQYHLGIGFNAGYIKLLCKLPIINQINYIKI